MVVDESRPVGGIGYVEAGANVAPEVEAYPDENDDEHDDDTKADTQCEVQPGFLLVGCGLQQK